MDVFAVRSPFGGVVNAYLPPVLPFAVIAISYGQSLAMRRTPKITTSPHADLYTFAGGSETGDQVGFVNDGWMQKVEGNFDSLVSFVENAAGEGWGGGLGYELLQESLCEKVVFYCPADGARHWRELKHGTGRWATMLVAIRKARDLLIADGYTNDTIKIAFIWTQGESDADTTTPGGVPAAESRVTEAQYISILQQVRDSLRFDLRNIFGEDRAATPVFVTPLNHQKSSTGSLAIQAAYASLIDDEESGLVFLPPHTQNWANMSTDGVHLEGQGRRHFAELAGSIIRRVLFDNGTYVPPHVITATRSGDVITATFATPDDSDMTIDTSTFVEPTTTGTGAKYGVQFYDTGAAGFITVNTITMLGKVATVTLASTPSGAGTLWVGQQPWPGSESGTAANGNTPRTNLRCTGLAITAEDGTTRYHYALPQRIAVA